MLQFTEGKFDPDHHPTLGVEYAARSLSVAGKDVKVQIWDTSGQQSFRSITRSYYRSAIIAMMVYDITRMESFQNLVKWLSEVKNYSHDKIEIVLLGNKSDLADKRQVPVEQAQKLAKANNLIYFQTSACKGSNIENSFIKATENVLNRINKLDINLEQENISNIGIKLGKRPKGPSGPSGPGVSQPSALKVDSKDKSEKCGC